MLWHIDYTMNSNLRVNTDTEEKVEITQQKCSLAFAASAVNILHIVQNTAQINDNIAIAAEADESTQVNEYKCPAVVRLEEEPKVKEQEILSLAKMHLFPLVMTWPRAGSFIKISYSKQWQRKVEFREQ